MITPLKDRVVVSVNRKTMTDGGLHIPETAKSKSRTHEEGTVLAVGPGRRRYERVEAGSLAVERITDERIPMDVKVGDRVIFTKFAGTEVELGGEKVVVLDENELLGTVS